MFDEITGRPQVKEYLTGYVNAPPFRPIILHGPTGVGKHYVAKLLSKYLNCDGSKDSLCQCNSCKAKIDIQIRKPTKNSWGVDDIRSLLSEVKDLPIGMDHRIVVIESINNISLEASDCFLKSIEESPVFNVFIFLSDSITEVIPTIRSRCQSLYIPPIGKEWMDIPNYPETFGLPSLSQDKKFSYRENGLIFIETVFNPDALKNLYQYKENTDIDLLLHDILATLDLYFCDRSEMILKRMKPIEEKWGKANIIAFSERIVGYLQLINTYKNISKWYHLFQIIMAFKFSMRRSEV